MRLINDPLISSATVVAPDADTETDWLIGRELIEHAKGARASAAANLFNAAVLAAIFSQSFHWAWIVAAAALLVGLIRHRLYWNARVAREVETASAGIDVIKQKLELNALLFGLWWGGIAGILLVVAAPGEQMLLCSIGAGMMAAGTITYRTMERAAHKFTVAICAGSLIGLISIGSGVAFAVCALLLCFAAVLQLAIRQAASSFRVMNQHERALRRSSDTISLLLNDYAEQGSDWLIEFDALGLIRNPSDRFAAATGRPAASLSGLQFAELIDCPLTRYDFLGQIAAGTIISKCEFPLQIGDQQRWWSISARPNGDGECGYRGVATDITARRLAEDDVRHMAHYDGLTALPNRFLFNESLNTALAQQNDGVGLMYLDLDHFKSVNDTLGHPVGDKLLQAVALRLQSCVRAGDLIARLGGDEFAIIIDGRNLDGINQLSTRIIETIGLPFLIDGYEVMTGASIGIAQSPADGETPEALLKNADLALYAAKAGGRNLCVRFHTSMGEAAESKRELELDLRSALVRDEMRLHYQPMMNVTTGNPCGYEALVRWEHGQRGIVMPADFIAIAEETGMVIKIGEWVIRQALSEAATWPEPLSIAINLSPAQMRSTTLLPTIVQALAHSNVTPQRVEIEITEAVLRHDSEANLAVLQRLRDLGLQIVLDDFGTGLSSLNYLRTFAFDKIKIDRCFIKDVDKRDDCRAIVRSLVALASDLGVRTTAEGVERESQLAVLREEGCHEVQGFLFSRAVTSEALSDLRPVARRRKAA